ncbi:hypothetical protein GIB67_012539 [Kingdonia uniflora]|uniref:Aminotransferase-like plant mobile domain-containing protein n=1 Tax=Kingdonia uniflora TaxID=39325 RepID=A0A7J7N5B4_9MAGN|nr:hypothetical protein GIB67_012539 [Kingdonia uniflora]
MPPKGIGKLPTTRGRKIVPTAFLRKRLNEERDDPSHPNYNNPPRVPAKRRKTRLTRVPLRDSSISGSLPRVSVTSEEEFSSTSDSQGESAEDFRGEDPGTLETQSSTDCFPYIEDKYLPSTKVLPERNSEQDAGENCPRDPSLLASFAAHRAKALVLGQSFGGAWERVQNIVNVWGLGRIGAISYKHFNSALITAFTEWWHPKTNSFHFKWREMTITLEDVSRLIRLRVDGDLIVVKGAWGALAVKEMWRKCMYLPDSVYPNLKVGGQGISLSLKKMEDLFAGKVGTNVHDSASASSIRLSSRMVGKAYMLYILGSFLFPTKKGTDVSIKYLSFFQDQHVSKPWSWGAATLAHLYYNLGASSKVNAKGLVCCTTLLEVIFDPYVEKREDKHMFEEVASFTVSFTKLCPDAINLAEDDDYDDERDEVPQNQNEGGGGPVEVVEDPARSVLVQKLEAKTLECETNKKLLKDLALECESTKKILEDQRLECESNKKLVEDLRMQLAAKVNETETLGKINDKLMEEVYVHQIEVPLPGVWRLALKGAIEGGDFEDPEDPTYEKLGRQFTKLLTIAQKGPKGEYEDDIILSGRGEYQEMIDSRDGNTAFKVAASYAYQSQIKFSNVKVSLCALMTKKPSYWKGIFSQRLNVACNDLRERRYGTLQQAFKFDAVFVEYLYMGHLLATYYEKVVIFISNKEALMFLPLFWPKVNNKITKDKRFENILVDSTKYWWVGMTSDENFVKLKTKYQSPIPSLSSLWWAHVKLNILDAFVKQCMKNYFDAPNEVWMKLMKNNNVNSLDYSLNDLILC